jgi:hypothetical protein
VLYDFLAAAPAPATSPTEPGLPYEQIGLILVAIVTGVTGIIVAIIQKGGKTATTQTSPPPSVTPHTTAGSFVLSETEWITIRDRAIRVEAAIEALRHEYNTHDQLSSRHMTRMNTKIEAIEQRLGL